MYVTDNNDKFPYPRFQVSNIQDQDTPQWISIATYHNTGVGDDVWFNALPNYVGNKPMYVWAYDPVTFGDAKSIFSCPTATAQGVDPADSTSTTDGSKDMAPKLRPLFGYGMNSKALANEQINDVNAILRTSIVKHPSQFVLFSDVRWRSAETPYYGSPDNQSHLATPHSYTTRFSSRHNKGGNITFSDGHSAYYKYDAIVADGIKDPSLAPGKDPANPEVNWDANGLRVP
jgi:prepilin-type processing-associated H-X9-DG protein